MEYRILGKSGLKISRLGFGGIPIQRIEAGDTKPLMHQLLEAGRPQRRKSGRCHQELLQPGLY